MSLEARLDDLERRLAEIETEWSRPEVAGNADKSRTLGREQARIEPIVANHRRLRQVQAELESARREQQAESDPELKELARELIAENEVEEARLQEELRIQLLPGGWHAVITDHDEDGPPGDCEGYDKVGQHRVPLDESLNDRYDVLLVSWFWSWNAADEDRHR